MDNNLKTWGLYKGKEYLSVHEATALAVGLHPDQVEYVESRNSNYDVLHDLFYNGWMYDGLGSDDCHSFFTTEIKDNAMRFRLSSIGQEIKQSVFKDWLTSIDYHSDYFHGEVATAEPASGEELTWRDLFICEKNSDNFRACCEAVTVFLIKNNKLPESHNVLFAFMKEGHGETMDRKLKFPKGNFSSIDNFRNSWNSYTGKYSKKPT